MSPILALLAFLTFLAFHYKISEPLCYFHFSQKDQMRFLYFPTLAVYVLNFRGLALLTPEISRQEPLDSAPRSLDITAIRAESQRKWRENSGDGKDA